MTDPLAGMSVKEKMIALLNAVTPILFGLLLAAVIVAVTRKEDR